jgi:predicted phosphoribosyltransferase
MDPCESYRDRRDAGQMNPRVVFERVLAMERAELERRERAYRRGRGAREVAGRCVIVAGVGQFYEDFSQTSDREVRERLMQLDTVS